VEPPGSRASASFCSASSKFDQGWICLFWLALGVRKGQTTYLFDAWPSQGRKVLARPNIATPPAKVATKPLNDAYFAKLQFGIKMLPWSDPDPGPREFTGVLWPQGLLRFPVDPPER
jgi:hypothetical protein